MTDQERAEQIVREVFLHDLKGEIGTLARLGVPLADRQDIIRRLAQEFGLIRKDERSKSAV
jgi:hypothetical protein